MKAKLGAVCNGRNKIEVEVDIDENTTDEDLSEMAREHGMQVTGFDYWFERVE